MFNPFFSNQGPFKIRDIIELLSASSSTNNLDAEVIDIKNLSSANKSCITFFHSKKYKTLAKNTKASFCISTDNLKDQRQCNLDKHREKTNKFFITCYIVYALQ